MRYNRITALVLLLVLLLAAPVSAAAGGAEDPLISRSYAEERFIPQVAAALQTLIDAAAARLRAQPAPEAGLRIVTLAKGDGVTLTDGQQLILLSGGVHLQIDSGKLVNCTLGRGSSGGDARVGHRYVVWDGARVEAKSTEGAVVAVSPGAETEIAEKPGENPFTDVTEEKWYFADVLSAYRRGLVNGMTVTTYVPELPQGTLTLAQAVTLAARMHQLYHDGAVTLKNAEDGRAWYETYAEYALEKGILSEMPTEGWNDAVARGTFVRIFFRALPDTEYAPINSIMDGAIPDVATDSAIAQEVYTFYTAGILTGYAADAAHQAHAFGADTEISRAEVATIMNRMFDPKARVRFDME